MDGLVPIGGAETGVPLGWMEEVQEGLVPGCFGCVLSTHRGCGKFTRVEGKGRLGVLLVGEASGQKEAAVGLPFRPKAPAGMVLERALREKGWTRDDVWITNVIRCHPPNDYLVGAPYEKAAIDHCRSNLDRVIEELKPKAIVALGATALRELTGLAGEKLNVTYLRGYVLPSVYGIPVIPTFHPSYLGRGTMKYFGMLIRDISKAVMVSLKGIQPCVDLSAEIECRTGIEDLREIYERALADPTLPICVDCESERSAKGDEDEVVEFNRDLDRGLWGDEGGADEHGEYHDQELEGSEESGELERSDLEVRSTVTSGVDIERSRLESIQFAVCREWGVYVPWTEGYIELALLILALPNPKIWHNGDLFDSPILIKHGAVINGRKRDSLVMQKSLQPDLPGHLQATNLNYRPNLAPWKHLAGTNPELYGTIDVCVLPDIFAGLERDMRKIKGPGGITVWDGYERWTEPMRPVLDGVTQRGLPVQRATLDELREWLGLELASIEGELQSKVPDELRRGKLAEGCKAVPADVKEWLMRERSDLWAPTYKTYKNGKVKEIAAKVKISDVYQSLMSTSEGWPEILWRLCTELGYAVRSFPVSSNPESSDTTQTEKRLVKLKDWNPGSSQQMLDYIRFKKYPVPLDFKTRKPTTKDKDLEKLWRRTKDPVLELSRKRRQTAKLRDSYTGKVGDDGVARGGWIPGPDGRLRATIKLTSATWQLKAVNPNILTLVKRRKELADRFRRCIAAETGYVMLEFDYSGFHSLMTAREARDRVLHKASLYDVHALVAGFMVRFPGIETAIEMPDEEFGLFLKEVRARYPDVRENQAKPLVHGINFGEGPKRIYNDNSEHFRDEAEARRLHGLVKRIFSATFSWQERIVEQAADEGKLVSNWGAVRWFWDALGWKWDDRRGWVRTKGSQAEQAMAFRPAANSHGMMRMKLIESEARGWNERYGLVNIPHDAIWLHCHRRLADEAIENVRGWLKAPVMELADAVMCPGGFVCNVDVKIGPNLAEMEKIAA